MYLFTAEAQRTQRFNYFLFSDERPRKGGITIRFKYFKGWPPENKKNQLYKVNLIARATIFVTYIKLKLLLSLEKLSYCLNCVKNYELDQF
jgi:hypothetical protein